MVYPEILISSSYCRPSYEEFYRRNGKMKAALERLFNYIKFDEPLIIKKIIINGPATIFFWADGSKTVVKCMEGDNYDLYNAFCIALTKKLVGSNSKIKTTLKKAKLENQNPICEAAD